MLTRTSPKTMVQSARRQSRRGFTLIELLVVISIIALLIGILLPSLGQAKLSAMKVKCQANCKGITAAGHSYAADHNGKCIPDEREPAWEIKDGVKTLIPSVRNSDFRTTPKTEEERKLSWFGQIETTYLSGERSAVDCPVIDDHRKDNKDSVTGLYIWYTDYSLNRFGFNRALDSADEPGRNIMFGEPNMGRASFTAIQEIVAFWMWWGGDERDRMDLEQLKAGSLSFGFVDGHATRVPIKDVKIPWLEEMPELSLSAGSPPTRPNPGNNFTWWGEADFPSGNYTQAVYPVPNDSVKGTGGN